jgi:hypothetical protein
MIVQIELQLRKCTNLVQCDVKIWFIDVFDEYQTRYMICCEHLELVFGEAQMCSPCSCKACDEIP